MTRGPAEKPIYSNNTHRAPPQADKDTWEASAEREVSVSDLVPEDLQSELYKVSLRGLKMETKCEQWTVAALNNETWVSIAKKKNVPLTSLKFCSFLSSFTHSQTRIYALGYLFL